MKRGKCCKSSLLCYTKSFNGKEMEMLKMRLLCLLETMYEIEQFDVDVVVR